MNRCVPTWHIDGASVPFSPELMSETDRLQPIEKEMQELVWRNGRLATQNFNQKPLRSRNEGVACAAEPGTFTSRPKQDLPESAAYSASLGSTDPRPPPFIQEDEMASWLLHYPVEDTLQYRDLVAPAPAANTLLDWNSVVPAAPGADPVEAPPRQAVHPPRPHVPGTEPQIVNFSLFASRTAGKMNRMMEPIRYETGSCSLYRDRVDVTVANSCKRGAAPQVLPPSHHPSQPARSTSDRHCSTLVSAPSPRDRKRKAEEPPEDSDSHSEDAYDQTVSTKTRSSRAKRRNRAAEIHNLSERRRRDRINEKMRALQELIPRCNKSDKASMLDEAIEYLKSLQLQVQMMSMGCGMPQMLYPGLPYPLLPPPMGVGMVPRLRNPVVIPFPPVVSSLAVPSSGAGPALYTNLPTPAGSTEPPIISPILPATVAECQQYLSQFQVPLTGRVPLPSSTSNAKSETPTAATQ